MDIKSHRAFLGLTGISLLVLIACTFVPYLMEYLALNSADPYSWRQITSLFDHGGLMHLFGNTLFVLPWALYIEPKIGWKRFTAVWLATGLFGNFLSNATPSLFPGGLSLGSSGCCMGMMAYAIAMMEEHWILKAAAVAILGIVGLREYQAAVITAFIPDGIGHGAHLGGFVAGLWLATRHK